jgi:hypothetical protein
VISGAYEFLQFPPDGRWRVWLGDKRIDAGGTSACRKQWIAITADEKNGNAGEARLLTKLSNQIKPVAGGDMQVREECGDFVGRLTARVQGSSEIANHPRFNVMNGFECDL